MAEASPLLRQICALNPFTHAVELIRFTLYLTPNLLAGVWVMLAALVFFGAAVWGYDPARGMMTKRGG